MACDVDDESDIEDLQAAMDSAEDFEALTTREEEHLIALRCAGIALSIEEQIKMLVIICFRHFSFKLM